MFLHCEKGFYCQLLSFGIYCPYCPCFSWAHVPFDLLSDSAFNTNNFICYLLSLYYTGSNKDFGNYALPLVLYMKTYRWCNYGWNFVFGWFCTFTLCFVFHLWCKRQWNKMENLENVLLFVMNELTIVNYWIEFIIVRLYMYICILARPLRSLGISLE